MRSYKGRNKYPRVFRKNFVGYVQKEEHHMIFKKLLGNRITPPSFAPED